MPGSEVECFACRTDVDIALCLIAEAIYAKELATVLVIGERNVGTDVLTFDDHKVLFGAVFAVSGGLSRPQFPAEARSPEQVQHGLVFGNFRGSHLHAKNDPGFAATDNIVGL